MKRNVTDAVANRVAPCANRQEQRAEESKRLDRYVTLSDAVRLFPRNRNGKFIHRSAIFRYAKAGKRGVVLQTWLVPPVGLCTNPRAVAEFIAALTATLGRPSAPKTNGHADAAAANQRLLNGVFGRGKGVSK